MCTSEQPCSSFAGALATDRRYIKVRGTIDERVTFHDRNVVVFGAPGAELTSSTLGPLITVSGASDVSIFDLTIKWALGTSDGWGIILRQAPVSPQPSLALERVVVRNSRRHGIFTEGLTRLRMSRCIVVGNYQGGAFLQGDFEITNSLFVANGSPTTDVGGVRIAPIQPCNCVFEFNTVAHNHVGADTSSADGVQCLASTTKLRNNIVAYDKIDSSCGPEYSLLDVGGGPVATNRFGDPQFKNVNPVDPLPPDFYRLMDGSPAIDGADPAGGVSTDIDGDTRPQGNAPDIGADEATP